MDELLEERPIAPGQEWFWSAAWQTAEKEAEEDLAAGRYETFDTMQDFLAGLEVDRRQRIQTSRATLDEYPGSQLMSDEYNAGSGGGEIRRVYGTSDPIEKVLAFAERDLPGFERVTDPGRGEIVYHNYRHYDGWLTYLQVDMSEYSSEAWIYPSREREGLTMIEVLISWRDERYR